jgi:hypothetical protein
VPGSKREIKKERKKERERFSLLFLLSLFFLLRAKDFSLYCLSPKHSLLN